MLPTHSYMKIDIVTLKLSHLRQMGENDAMQNGLRMMGLGLCVLADGEPVAAGGIVRLWDEVGKAWALHTERSRASALILRRCHVLAKQQIPLVRHAMGLRRLEADTLAEPQYCTWLSRLGFIWEGEMRSYKDGKTYARFAWVRG